MLRESVWDVLRYLFDNYLNEGGTLDTDRDTLVNQLRRAGFRKRQVRSALGWIEGLAAREAARLPMAPAGVSLPIRHFTPEECTCLPPECRGYLHKLEAARILDPGSRELSIDRAMALEQDPVSLEQLRWIVMMVLANDPSSVPPRALLSESVSMSPGMH